MIDSVPIEPPQYRAHAPLPRIHRLSFYADWASRKTESFLLLLFFPSSFFIFSLDRYKRQRLCRSVTYSDTVANQSYAQTNTKQDCTAALASLCSRIPHIFNLSSATFPLIYAPSDPPRASTLTSRQPELSLRYLVAFLFALLTLVLHLLNQSHTDPTTSKSLETSPAVCIPTPIFHDPLPVCLPHKMTLLDQAKAVAAQFEYPPAEVNRGVKAFLSQMHEGLQQSGTSLSQIPTFVTDVPNGTEKGVYLAIDLGGTNFRVCSINLHGNSTFSLTQAKVPIPRELMVAKTSHELFAFLAQQIEAFLRTHHAENFEAHLERVRSGSSIPSREIFQLGFTFSFPVQQQGINKGTLIRWTKGFAIDETIGQDVCELLQKEIDTLGLPVKVAALVNDTVGTLLARSYTSPGKSKTVLGAIFGTGTNGAYVEKLDKITKLHALKDSKYDRSTGHMIINSEWGSFDNQLSVLPNTRYDQAVDKASVNPGFHIFEKRISGMFLGEILRLVLLGMVQDANTQLFKDVDSSTNDENSTTSIAENSALYKQWGIDTSFLSVAQADSSPGLRSIRLALAKDMDIDAASAEDAEAVKVLVSAIGRRSARLSAVAIAAIIIATEHNKTPTADASETIDIGVDGSLVEYYPGFEDMIREALREADGIGAAVEKRVRIAIAKDGSGVGAALIALVAARAGG